MLIFYLETAISGQGCPGKPDLSLDGECREVASRIGIGIKIFTKSIRRNRAPENISTISRYIVYKIPSKIFENFSGFV